MFCRFAIERESNARNKFVMALKKIRPQATTTLIIEEVNIVKGERGHYLFLEVRCFCRKYFKFILSDPD